MCVCDPAISVDEASDITYSAILLEIVTKRDEVQVIVQYSYEEINTRVYLQIPTTTSYD